MMNDEEAENASRVEKNSLDSLAISEVGWHVCTARCLRQKGVM